MNRDNIYKLLGINQYVSSEVVKRAFKDFAKRNHPDLFPGDRPREEKFKKVTAAYHSWKLVQGAVSQIKRLKTNSPAGRYGRDDIRPYTFTCWA